MTKILLVEDDRLQNKSLSDYLKLYHYSVKSVYSGLEALNVLHEEDFDLIISDIMMPSLDGYSLATFIRDTNKNIPIIFTTAKGDISSKEAGYSIGIDDYMVKPINFKELLLRIEALLRRAKIENNKIIKIGDVTLNKEEHAAYIQGEEVQLTNREFDILFKLLSFPKKTFSRSALMDEFWAEESANSSRSVDIYITRLRTKFNKSNAFQISTIYGLGYKAIINDQN